MKKKENNTINPDYRRLKYSEWRPIGVCDTAEPGKQKAQMFTREDFLIITADGVTRENWQQNHQVKSVIMKYVKKLEKMSTLTKSMKSPSIKRIKLVGAIMKLSITPNLNQESRDGKLQLFQVEFEEQGSSSSKHKGKSKLNPWTLTIGILVSILVCLLSLIAYKITNQDRSLTDKVLNFNTSVISYCQYRADPEQYYTELSESWDLISQQNNNGIQNGLINNHQKCILTGFSITEKENQFIKCYKTVSRTIGTGKLSFSDQKRVDSCFQNICRKPSIERPSDCY